MSLISMWYCNWCNVMLEPDDVALCKTCAKTAKTYGFKEGFKKVVIAKIEKQK